MCSTILSQSGVHVSTGCAFDASPLAPSGLSVFAIVSRCGPDGQLLQPCGQPLELLVCAEFVQAVNADLNRLGVVVGDIVDVFGVTH
jgi:hypothetical protein